jgi:putative FmdB family regulatory protein
MPIYQYKCSECGNIEEHLEKINAVYDHRCGRCHQTTLERTVTAPAGFEFKGSGFYQTDFKSKK